MKIYEYLTKIIDAKGLWGGKINDTEFNKTLNEIGLQGWELVGTTAANEALGSTCNIICVFKREIKSKK